VTACLPTNSPGSSEILDGQSGNYPPTYSRDSCLAVNLEERSVGFFGRAAKMGSRIMHNRSFLRGVAGWACHER